MPDELGAAVDVINATTLNVVSTLRVGRYPHHVTPSWNMRRLYVNDMESDRLDVINPFTRRRSGTVATPARYNLYFTPDGSKAIVIAEPLNRIDFYRRSDWTLLRRLSIPSAGVDHGDFTADGNKLVVGTEFDGWLFKINVRTMRITDRLYVGGKPSTSSCPPMAPSSNVANQGRGGASIVEARTLREIRFLRTGSGAHGMAVRRDGKGLYVSNRRAGTISVIDFATRSVVATWNVGGSPDMLSVSIDGGQLWASNRWHRNVSVINTANGHVIRRIAPATRPTD